MAKFIDLASPRVCMAVKLRHFGYFAGHFLRKRFCIKWASITNLANTQTVAGVLYTNKVLQWLV